MSALLAADAAGKRARAAAHNGIGDMERATKLRGAAGQKNPSEELFGERCRSQLRETLERTRAKLALSCPTLAAPATDLPSWICCANKHVCLLDVEQGCPSCQATCHADCASDLCRFQPCGFCLSHSVAALMGSPICLEVQETLGQPHTLDDDPPVTSTSLVLCTAKRHICREDSVHGCRACEKTCHQDSKSPLCGFFGFQRSDLPLHGFQPSDRDLLDTRMLQQELGGRLKHRTEFQWRRVGRDDNGQRVVHVDGNYYFLGTSDGSQNDCLIHSLRQCLGINANVAAVRNDLMQEFQVTCGPACHHTGFFCTASCTKVYARNYLCDDHWDAVLRLLGKHCATGSVDLDPTNFCVRILELTWVSNGVVLGNPDAHHPHRLTIAREGTNHFIPALPFQAPARDKVWRPWV